MPESLTTLLRLAEEERHRAELALDAHYDLCDIWPQEDCERCRALAVTAAAAAAEVGRLRWRVERVAYEKARRMRRGKRPAPVISGLRVDPRRQP